MPEVDLSAELSHLAGDVCRRVKVLAHIDPEALLFTLSRSRALGEHGLYARICPLRPWNGNNEVTRRQRGRLEIWRLPRLQHEGRDILYLINLLVPRFFRLSFREKLHTLLHELYHISPSFDGSLRRFPGRCHAHGRSRRRYDADVAVLVDDYLGQNIDPALFRVLEIEEEDWQKGTVRIVGLFSPLPRAKRVVSSWGVGQGEEIGSEKLTIVPSPRRLSSQIFPP